MQDIKIYTEREIRDMQTTWANALRPKHPRSEKALRNDVNFNMLTTLQNYQFTCDDWKELEETFDASDKVLYIETYKPKYGIALKYLDTVNVGDIDIDTRKHKYVYGIIKMES